QLPARDAQQLGESVLEALAAPARLAEDARVLGPDREQAVEGEHELRVVERAQAGGEAARQRLGIARDLVDEAARALAAEAGDGARARGGAERAGERLPGRALLVLGEAEGELAGVPVRGAVDLSRPPAADVPHDELERAPDREVRAVALAEDVPARAHP